MIYEAEQKYQNLHQLFTRSVIVCMAVLFYLPRCNVNPTWKNQRLIRQSFESPMILSLTRYSLMIINWGIEAFKWKISVQRIQR